MTRKKRVIMVLAVTCAVVTLVLAARLERPAKHFRVVREGVMYRGAQPDARGIHDLRDVYGVKTVVNLRGPCPGASWWQAEKEACDKNGLRMIDIRLNRREYIEPGLKEFLAVAADKANQPIFVHCEIGTARTGFVVAAWRIAAEKWTFDRALAEAQQNRFKPNSDLNPEFVRMLRSLADGAEGRKPDSIPDSAAGE